MKKRLIAGCAALCACAMLMNGLTAFAEERRLGDYIYVPAMQVQSVSGTISLRVQGIALDAAEDDPQVIQSLAGAEFGVYVISGSGEVRPWANPLYPSEQMRIRTGEGETRFSLPQGAEYYLRQESAPQGYLYDSETLIPVTGEEIVVVNAMAGQLAVTVADSLGEPLSGVVLTATGEDGSLHTLTTDEKGEATLACSRAQTYSLVQSELPQGVFAAQRATVDGQQASLADAVQIHVAAATRARVHYEHPASGAVELVMTLDVIDDNAQMQAKALADVAMEISGGMLLSPMTVVTDEDGRARASLMEGTYDVRFAYRGDEDVILPLEYGQMIVSSGTTTLIELAAKEEAGRIVLMADAGRPLTGGSVMLRSSKGKAYGPYSLDAEGMAVSDPLPAGEYEIRELITPEGMQAGTIAFDGVTAQRPQDLVLTVQAGEIAQVSIVMLSREKQTFALMAQSLDEGGEVVSSAITGNLELDLIDVNGQTAAKIHASDAEATIEALSGTYALRMDERKAKKLGIQQTSGLFELPAGEEVIAFASVQTRVRIASVDENGEPVPGARYSLTDSRGAKHEILCDKDGMGVSALMEPGEVTIQTITAPEAHDYAQEKTMQAAAGEALDVEMVHESYGAVHLSVRMQSLDVSGQASHEAMNGALIHLYQMDEEGTGMTDTGITLLSVEDGMATVQLPAGEYVAHADAEMLEKGVRAPQALRFTVSNMQSVEGELVFMAPLGGVRAALTGGSLSDEQLAQVRFELTGSDGTIYELMMQDGAFYAGGLVSGTYVLRQTQIPEGFTLAAERTVSISGGEVTQVDVPLEEYAVLTVNKTGLTFDDALKTYIVPLSGEYGVYTMKDGAFAPYPSEASQMTIWANVTPQQMEQGKAGSAKLPAGIDGTTYYLHELSRAQGFGEDDTYYEVVLRAGENQTLQCAVSSDRGFFCLEQIDAATGEHLPGGLYELTDASTGETVLSFEMGEDAYRNQMAVPVGSYLLRHVKAAPGYALSSEMHKQITIEPYLTQGGMVTEATMHSAPIPQTAVLDLIRDVYAAREQGLTLLTVDTAALGSGEMLLAPAVTVRVGAAGSERSNILSLVITGTGDDLGTPYMARVEYCLRGGGWQPSDARMTGVLGGPTAVSLADVQDDVSAVRVTYINADTGEEAVLGGFTPGQIALSIQASAAGDVNMVADVSLDGVYAYRTAADEPMTEFARSAQRMTPFVMQADGVFTTVCAGRDGRISGVAFFDEDADGVMDAKDTGRYAGLNVSLLNQNGDVLDSCRTGTDGAYAFTSLSGGVYALRFDAGENVVFSSGSIFSPHRISGVADARYGTTDLLTIDGDHTDYVIQAGCIYASSVEGSVREQMTQEESGGFAGMTVELRAQNAAEEDEPFVTVTDGMGSFAFSRILPGTYELSIRLPEGYLCSEATGSDIVRDLHLIAGDTVDLGEMTIQKKASVSGCVRIDDDGDGVIDEGASVLEGVRVMLLRAQDGHTEQIAQVVTGADGAYLFDALPMGEYSVLFELGGQWAFTRHGGDSLVYGAVSQSGSTKSFVLLPGQAMTGIDAGVTIPAQMSVSVFKDTQYDGQKGAYEEMLEGVSISLIRLENGEDAEEITYRTNEEGSVVFAGVSPGEYVIAYQMPGEWRATKQVDPRTTHYRVSSVPQSSVGTGRSEPFTLSMGQSGLNMYIGAMLSGSISGYMYYDDNADAQMDPNEEAIHGAKVELLGADGDVIADTHTSEDGSYTFEGLAPGRYRVRFTADEGCGFSGTERTVSRGGVQESDESVATTRTISVSGGSATESADAGVVRLSRMSGVIWEDQNADQIMDGAEPGVGGVSVNLMNSTGRTVITTVTTDEQGRFVFEHLRPGTYTLRVDAPQDHVFSGALAGSALPLASERSGRGYSAAFTVLGGANVDGVGFGVLTQGTVSGRVWQDLDYDGLMEAAEEGLRGAKVMLSDIAGNTVRETTTIRSGEFAFDHLMPGEYALSVTLPQGYVFTAEGGDSLAPDDQSAEANLYLGMLSMGGAMNDVRIGALRPASLSGQIWFDADDDGRRQTEDQPMRGVCAVLEMTDGADSGKRLETVSDENGTYHFDGVMPGKAKITFELENGYAFARRVSGTRRVSVVPMANSLTASTDVLTVASGAELDYLDVGVVRVGTVSGTIWEDSVYDGKQGREEIGVASALVELVETASGRVAASAVTGETGSYVIGFARKGEYTARVTLPEGMIFTRSGEGILAGMDSDTAQTAAFALAMGDSRERMSAGAIRPAHMNGKVIVDANEDGICGDSEEGCSGVVVTAMQGGTVVAAVRTQEDGGFAFDMLRPGTYRLRYALGEEALFAKGVGLRMADADAQEGETDEYVLSMGQVQSVAPVPVVRSASIFGSAWIDANVNGLPDADETMMTGVTAQLLDAQGEVLASASLGDQGRYAFKRLRSGTYTVRFTLEPDMLFTDYLGAPGGSSVPVVPGNVADTQKIVLTHGEQRGDVNVGGILPGEIGDTVWLDRDGNGLQDYREPQIPGVSLTLLRVGADGAMQEAAHTESDEYGYYKFELLRPGAYVIRLNAQPGDTITYHFGEPLGEIDSDLNPDSGMSEIIRLSSGQTIRNIDVGLTEHGE